MILDHAFVLPRGLDPAGSLRETTLAAADVFSARLAAAGFAEGSSRSHPGQGTANRRLFLDDFMIECLLVDDEAALDHPRGAALALGPRFRGARASAVGIAFRPAVDAAGELPAPAFPAMTYRPAYLPQTLHIDVAREPGPECPLLFHLPFARRGDAVPDDGEPRMHPNGARGIAGVFLERMSGMPADVLATLEGVGVRCAPDAPAECLHVGLRGLDPGVRVDFRPLFPLRLHG